MRSLAVDKEMSIGCLEIIRYRDIVEILKGKVGFEGGLGEYGGVL